MVVHEPVITLCAPDLTVSGNELGAELPDLTAQIQVTDICTPSDLHQIAQNPPPGTFVAPGEHVVTFTVVNARGANAHCQCTVVIHRPSPSSTVSISDSTVMEGNGGTSEAVFIVSLSAASVLPVSVNFETCPMSGPATARPGLDYVPYAGTVVFEPGEIGKTIPVNAHGSAHALIHRSPPSSAEGIELRLARSEAVFLATWTAPAGAFQLQERDDLGTQTDWRIVGLPVLASGNNRTVVLPNCRSTGFYRLARAEASEEDGASQPVRVEVLADVLCEPDERFAVNLSRPVNAVIGKAQGIATIRDDDCSGDPVEVLVLPSSPGPETDLVHQYLAEEGLTCRFLDPAELTADSLTGCHLVIWDDCGTTEELRADKVASLRQAHTEGIPLYLIGGHLAGAGTNLAEPFRSQWTDLTGLLPANSQSDNDHISVLLASGHHVVNGAFGFVEDFACEPLESVTVAGIDHTVLARWSESAAVLAWEDALSGTRRVTQNFLLSSFSADPASVGERRRLFLNSVWWLLGRPFCGLTDLAVTQTASPTAVSTNVPVTFLVTVQRSGECPAADVTVTDILPPNVTLQSVIAPQGVWTHENGVVTFNLGAFDAMFLELRVTVVPLMPGPLVNRVKIRGNDRDPSLGNNLSSLEILVLESGADARE